MGANDGRTQYTPLDNAAPGGDLDFDGLEPGAVLLVSAPMRGHVNQSLIVAETLATRGYDVHFATIGARAQPWVERGAVPGVKPVRVPGPDDANVFEGPEWEAVTRQRCWATGARARMALRGFLLGAKPRIAAMTQRYAEFMQQAVDELKPQAILLDYDLVAFCPLPGGKEGPGCPVITFNTASANLEYPSPFDLGIGALLSYVFEVDTSSAANFVTGLGYQALALADACTQNPVLWLKSLVGMALGSHPWEPDYTLMLTSADMVYNQGHRGSSSSSYMLTGPLLPPLPKGPGTLPADLEDWLEDERPCVYVSFGTVCDTSRPAFLKALVKGLLAGAEFYQVLWSLPEVYQKSLPPLPEGPECNIRFESFVPQYALLARENVQLCITHCGLNTSNECIATGTPVLGIPMVHDQFYNAVRLKEIGIGQTLHRKLVTAERVKRTVMTMLGLSAEGKPEDSPYGSRATAGAEMVDLEVNRKAAGDAIQFCILRQMRRDARRARREERASLGLKTRKKPKKEQDPNDIIRKESSKRPWKKT